MSTGAALYARARRWHLVMLIGLAVSIGGVVVGSRQLPVGVRDGMPTGAPLWAYLPIVTGTLVTLSTCGPVEQVDHVASRAIGRWNAAYATVLLCALAGTAAAVGMLASTWSSAHLDTAAFAVASARNVVTWTGVCLLSARLLRPGQVWLPAIALVFVMEWFGRDANGAARWWAFAVADGADPRTTVLCVTLVAAGLAVTCLDPTWGRPRRARLRGR